MADQSTFIIVITGPESSGKTTLTRDLATYFRAPMVEEFARTYLAASGPEYVFEDLEHIARGQAEEIERALLTKPPLLFVDTAFVVLEIWSSRKFNLVPAGITEYQRAFSADHYILCMPDIPWEYDPLRESKHEREELFEDYRRMLESRDFPFTVISGTKSKRLEAGIRVVRALQNP